MRLFDLTPSEEPVVLRVLKAYHVMTKGHQGRFKRTTKTFIDP